MRALKFLIFTIVCALGAEAWSQTTLAAWEVGSLTGGNGNYGASPYAPSSSNANVTVGGFTRGSGIGTSGTAAGGAWGGVSLTETSQANGISNNDVVTMTITANTGYQMSLSTFHYKRYRRSGTGPTNGALQYRVGAGAYTDVASYAFSSTSSSGATLPSVDLSGISALQNIAAGTTITFRIVLWGGSMAAGTWYIYDQSATTDLDITGSVSPVVAESITTGSVTVAPFNLANCAATATGSVAYTKTGTFNAGNVFTAQLSDASGSFSSATDIGSITSQNNGNINITIPAGTTSGAGYLIRVVGSNPSTTGSSSSAFTINQSGLCASVASHYFRSTQTGDWNQTSTWESSPDQTTWIPATLTPTSSSSGIIIRTGHTVTVNSTINLDEARIDSGATLNYTTGGNISINNGTGDDLTIFGTFTHGNVALPSISGIIRVKPTGIIRVNFNTGSSSNTYGANNSVVYENGATFNWNVTSSFGTSNVNYFPGTAASDIPVFLISANISNAGAANQTSINGVLKISDGMNVSWTNAGTKTFRNGIQIGAGATLSQTNASGAFVINGTNAHFDGPGTLSLGTAGLNSTATTISNGSDITVNTTGGNVNITNAWIGNNHSITGTGEMIFGNSTISGNTTFQRIGVNGNANISAGASNLQRVSEYANLRSGTLNTNNNILFLSDASGTAYLNDFGLFTGTVNGNIQMQRYCSGPSGYRQLGTPVAMPNISGVSGFTVSGIPGFVIPLSDCNPNYVASNSPYGSWLQLVENATPLYNCSQSLFEVLTSGGMTNARGYYMDATNNSTLTFVGTPNTGIVNLLTSHTLANTGVTNGWNMVSNPYPSPLAWETPGINIPVGIDAIAKLWITTGAYTGTWQDLDPSAAGTQSVAIGQAFQVRVTLPGTTVPFLLDNTDRTTSAPSFLMAGGDPMTLNIDIQGNGFADLTKVRFIDGASDGLDAMFDSPKMLGNPNQPMVYTIWDGKNYSTNSFGNLDEVYTLPLGIKLATSEQHTFVFSNIDQFPASALIYLEDVSNGIWQDLRADDSYTFTQALGTIENRFKLHFYPPVEKNTIDATCENGGSLLLAENSPANWNYELKNSENQTLSQGNLNAPQTINDLPTGDYTLILTEQTSGYLTSEIVHINGMQPVSAQAEVLTTNVEVGQELQFIANTQNATSWAWNFGDGNTSAEQNPSHVYNASGDYQAILTATNQTCEAVSTIHISTYSIASVNDEMADAGVKLWNDNTTVYINFDEKWDTEIYFSIYDMNGKKVLQQKLNGNQSQTIDCSALSTGAYTVELSTSERKITKKIIVGK